MPFTPVLFRRNNSTFIARNRFRPTMTTRKFSAISLLPVLMLSACASLTPDEEIAIGEEQVQEINASLQLIDDPVVSAYIDTLVAQLLADVPAPDNLKLRVIDSDTFNAFAI